MVKRSSLFGIAPEQKREQLMKASPSMIETIVNDLVSQRFDEADDIIRFVQNRLGKADSQKASAFWAGQEHMIVDRQTLKAYVKSEVES